MEFRDFLPTVLRRWKFVSLCVIGGVLLPVFLAFNTAAGYVATVRVSLSVQAATSSEVLQASPLLKIHTASFAAVATSESTLARIQSDLKFTGTRAQLARSIAVTPEVNSLVIQVRQTSPELASRVANAVARQAVNAISRVERPTGREQDALIVASIVGDASQDVQRITPRLPIKIAAGLAIGLLIGAAGAAVRELMDTSVRSGEVAAAVTGANLLATVPAVVLAGKSSRGRDAGSNAPIDEALRLLRTNLQFIGLDSRPRSVVVTSALAHEGKTLLCTNLARLIAESGQSVLVIDGDLRNPEAAEQLGLDNAVGLTSVLVGGVGLDQAIQRHGSGLAFLGTGRIPPNPTEVLESRAMRDLLGAAQRRFDLVLIDAPPVLPIADGQVLAAQADSVLFVAAHGRTRRDHLSQAAERIKAVGGHLAGVVMNLAPAKSLGHGHAYGAAARSRRATFASPKSTWGERFQTAAVFLASAFALAILSYIALVSPVLAVAGAATLAIVAVLGLDRGGAVLMVLAAFLAPMNNVRTTAGGFALTAGDAALLLGIGALLPGLLVRPLRVPRLYTAGVIGLLVISFVASIFSPSPVGSILAMPKLIVSTVLIPMIFVWWKPERRILLAIALAFCAGQVVSVIYGEFDPVQQFRTYGLSTHVNNFGLASLLAIALLPYIQALLPRNLRWIVYPVGLVCAVGLWDSGSRAALVILILLAVIYPMVERSGRVAWTGLLLATLGVIGSSSILTVRGDSALGRLLGGDNSTNSDTERTARLSEGWHAFLERPLLGRGYDGVLLYHNIYLAMAVAIGVFGALALVMMLVATSLPILTQPRPAGRAAYVSVAYALFAALSTNLWDRFVWILLAVVLAACQDDPPAEPSGGRRQASGRRLAPSQRH